MSHKRLQVLLALTGAVLRSFTSIPLARPLFPLLAGKLALNRDTSACGVLQYSGQQHDCLSAAAATAAAAVMF